LTFNQGVAGSIPAGLTKDRTVEAASGRRARELPSRRYLFAVFDVTAIEEPTC
jgi:hypothetical protein